jgi:NADP-dependent 3-hydroxy acid dehydrogenase YdfG
MHYENSRFIISGAIDLKTVNEASEVQATLQTAGNSRNDAKEKPMTTIHPAFKEDNVAVITGAASGIGLAAARKFAGFGMSVVLVDLDGDRLAAAHADILAVAKDGEAQIVAIPTDISKLDELEALERAVIQRFGRVHVLMNNAGIQPGSAIFGPQANW